LTPFIFGSKKINSYPTHLSSDHVVSDSDRIESIIDTPRHVISDNKEEQGGKAERGGKEKLLPPTDNGLDQNGSVTYPTHVALFERP
jgi:hypothetical protein